MTQLPLFTGHDLVTARARQTDVATSHAAAERHERSGAAATHRLMVERAVLLHPGETYRQLATITGLDCVEVMRRLGDLQKAGLVRKGDAVSLGGRSMSTWFAK